MANIGAALIELGKLLGFFEASDDDAGSVRWVWFKDPIGSAFDRIPAEREPIGAMLRALLDRAETTGAFSGDNNWEPLVVIDAITAVAGAARRGLGADGPAGAVARESYCAAVILEET